MQNPSQISPIYNSACLFARASAHLKPAFLRYLSLVFSEILHNDTHPKLKKNGRNVFLKLEFSLRWTIKVDQKRFLK